MKRVLFLVIVVLCMFSCNKEEFSAPTLETVEIQSLTLMKTLPKGTELIVRTVWDGNEVIDLKAKFVKVADEMLAPLSLYMVEGTDEKFIQLKGAAQGMSGSPVIYNGKIIGALSYGFSGQENPPFYFFVTPIEYMINPPFGLNEKKAEISALKSATKNSFCQINTPLVGSGLKPQAMDFMNKAGFKSSLAMDALASGTTESNNNKMIPGSSIAMCIIMGDQINLGAIGTVTYIDETGSIYAFGHPFFGTGEVECPYTSAEILGEISNISGSFKFGSIGKDILGTIKHDGTPGISGKIGETPEMIRVNSSLTLPDGKVFNFQHQSIKKGLPMDELSYYAAYAAYVPLINIINNGDKHSLITRTQIHFAETERIIDQTSISIEDSDWGLLNNSAFYQMRTCNNLLQTDFGTLTITRIDVDSKLINSVKKSTITDLEIDTTGIYSTNKFKVGVVLRGEKAGKYEKIFTLPDHDYKQAFLNVCATSKRWEDPSSLSEFLDKANNFDGVSTLEIRAMVNDSILKTEWNLQTIIDGENCTTQEISLQ